MRLSEVSDHTRVEYPRGDPARHLRRVAPLLLPLSWLYGAGVATVRRVRLIDAEPRRGGPHVVSVGNLEVGGSGENPRVHPPAGAARRRGGTCCVREPWLRITRGAGRRPHRHCTGGRNGAAGSGCASARAQRPRAGRGSGRRGGGGGHAMSGDGTAHRPAQARGGGACRPPLRCRGGRARRRVSVVGRAPGRGHRFSSAIRWRWGRGGCFPAGVFARRSTPWEGPVRWWFRRARWPRRAASGPTWRPEHPSWASPAGSTFRRGQGARWAQ